MRTSTIVTVALGAGVASAASVKRSGNLTAVTVKGNGALSDSSFVLGFL
jgi:TPP-dependent pyruvate/acetoin dehydrogenase alpha subunit